MQWQWVVKHTLGFFAHGKNMARWQFWSVLQCPQCETKVEDKAHIMQWPSVEAQQTWSQSLKTLQQWFLVGISSFQHSAMRSGIWK